MKCFINKFKYYIIAILFCLACCLGVFTFTLTPAKAEEIIQTTLVSHSSALEYYELNSPIDAFLWDNNVAIIQSEDTLLVWNGSEYVETDWSNKPKQVKKFGDKLLVSDNGEIHEIADCTNPQNHSYTGVNCNDFDLNDNYLISAYSTSLSVHAISSGVINASSVENINISTDSRICIDGNNRIFYVSNAYIYKHVIGTSQSEDVAIVNCVPTAMTVIGDYLYYSYDNGIYRAPIDGSLQAGTRIEIQNSDYELGNLSNPESMCVKDGKLIITDSALDAIQEFEIVESGSTPTLKFTGFAITKGKSAFNRIKNDVSIIEKRGDKTVVVDNEYLTVIENGEYIKMAITDLPLSPTAVCIGDDYIFITDGNAVKTVEGGKNTNGLNGVKDLYYQSGKCYALCYDDENAKASVFIIDEKELTVTKQLEVISNENLLLAVDLYGNIYLSDNGSVKLYLQSKNYGENEAKAVTAFNNPIDIYVDIEGKLFTLDNNGKVFCYDSENQVEYAINGVATNAKAVGFALDSLSEEIAFIFDGEEIITTTLEINNRSFKDGVAGIFEPLAYVKDLVKTTAPTEAYVTTGVNLYALPKITEDDLFVLENIRLTAGTKITPSAKILFDGVEFYKAKVIVDEVEKEGYIPVSFTATKLSENAVENKFTLAKVNKTEVYSEIEMQNKVADLNDGETVRIIEINDGVAHINYKLDGEWKDGYILADAITKTPNTAIRNVLIIIAVVTSLAVTGIFFVLRKKN